ncbi:MAG: hypothetical protein MUD08_05185 [Cytophagales bacterium]|jgi:hypothetical protein|nr:hypothetical protein [Cytophagales bacterium]
MQNSEPGSGSSHSQLRTLAEITGKIQKEMKLLDIRELNLRREYLEQLMRHNKLMMRLRELEITQGVNAAAELRRRERIRNLVERLKNTPPPPEPDLADLEARRQELDQQLLVNMKTNVALLATEAVNSGRCN